jgi:hypothetical protein
MEIRRTQLYWNILYLLYGFIQATCFDPLKGSSSGHRSIYKSHMVYAYLPGSRSVSFTFKHMLRWNVWNWVQYLVMMNWLISSKSVIGTHCVSFVGVICECKVIKSWRCFMGLVTSRFPLISGIFIVQMQCRTINTNFRELSRQSRL